MTFDIENLRELALAAAGEGEWYDVGLWVESDSDDEPDVCICDPTMMGQPEFDKTHRGLQFARSAYIAAVQPRVLLEILEVLSNHREASQMTIDQRAIQWIIGDDTGMSSKAIWAVMMGGSVDVKPWNFCPPWDPSDFGRCYRLFELIPEWEARLEEMAKHLPRWAPFIEKWQEMKSLWENESTTGECPKLYNLMRKIRID